jgi:pimeloyl-ACP methyl ester carboxylesterase
LIAADRPGIGGSDVLKARTFGDCPSDVIELADGLGIDRFAVVGVSAGGPYAAACAALISSRLTAAGVVSSRVVAQYNFVERPAAYGELNVEERADYDLAQIDPVAAADRMAMAEAQWVSGLQQRPESLIDLTKWPECDHWFFADHARTQDFFSSVQECVRQGMEGFRWEMIDAYLPWGFRLDTIPMRVHLWHGEQDPRVTKAQVDFTAQRIPDCVLVTWPDAGHMGMAKHWDEILAALV